jgi:hypothetical protein
MGDSHTLSIFNSHILIRKIQRAGVILDSIPENEIMENIKPKLKGIDNELVS